MLSFTLLCKLISLKTNITQSNALFFLLINYPIKVALLCSAKLFKLL